MEGYGLEVSETPILSLVMSPIPAGSAVGALPGGVAAQLGDDLTHGEKRLRSHIFFIRLERGTTQWSNASHSIR